MSELRERVQALVDAYEEWKVSDGVENHLEYSFLARKEGPYLARKLIEALDVLEKIAYTFPYDRSFILGSNLARQFLEGSTGDDRG